MPSYRTLGWACLLGSLTLAVYGGVVIGLRADVPALPAPLEALLATWTPARQDAFSGLAAMVAVDGGAKHRLMYEEVPRAVHGHGWAAGKLRAVVPRGKDRNETATVDVYLAPGSVATPSFSVVVPAEHDRQHSEAAPLRAVRLLFSEEADGWEVTEATRSYTAWPLHADGGLEVEAYSKDDPYVHIDPALNAHLAAHAAERDDALALMGIAIGAFAGAFLIGVVAVVVLQYAGASPASPPAAAGTHTPSTVCAREAAQAQAARQRAATPLDTARYPSRHGQSSNRAAPPALRSSLAVAPVFGDPEMRRVATQPQEIDGMDGPGTPPSPLGSPTSPEFEDSIRGWTVWNGNGHGDTVRREGHKGKEDRMDDEGDNLHSCDPEATAEGGGSAASSPQERPLPSPASALSLGDIPLAQSMSLPSPPRTAEVVRPSDFDRVQGLRAIPRTGPVSGWTQLAAHAYQNHSTLTVHSRPFGVGDAKQYLVRGLLHASPEHIFAALHSTGTRHVWDPFVAEASVLEQVGPSERAVHYRMHPGNVPHIGAGRDYVVHAAHRVAGKAILTVAMAADHPGAPRRADGVVRVEQCVHDTLLAVSAKGGNWCEYTATYCEGAGTQKPRHADLEAWAVHDGLHAFFERLFRVCLQRPRGDREVQRICDEYTAR
eukprot:TRINITY_DN16606_c0_g1_i1.p1 TRINITY_DN16606_c0_g1~~TRINITY_DN16606_c0_g1_i1.p1  ORF type:complete len:660 (+),score=116.52 TRINITY_DN16606_c0_g1_i1:65-2044(+)